MKLSKNEFTPELKLFFKAEEGAYSKVTDREYYDSQITLTDKEATLVLSTFGKDNIHVGKVSDNKDKSSKRFILYPHMEAIWLNLVYPKPEKTELRLYLSASKGFKPNSGDIWFIYLNENKDLVLGSSSEENWKTNILQILHETPNSITGLTVFNIAIDDVINSYVGLGKSSYKFALDYIHPLSARFPAQRKILESDLYARLERDILKNCLMPPITLAFVEIGLKFDSPSQMQDYVEKNIDKGYVLDGLQRLTTLKNASEKDNFNDSQELFYNIIISENADKLLYRMITLNNGQKGMTPRHQIEILTQELFDFRKFDIVVQTEKEKSENPIPGSYNFGDLAKGYLAFLTSNVHNENSKIIEEKMDEILVGRILDTNANEENKLRFTDIINFLVKFKSSQKIQNWLQTANNFVGFCVGIKQSYDLLFSLEQIQIEEMVDKFENAFKIVNPSKINVGKYRRELTDFFIRNAVQFVGKNQEYINEQFISETV